MPTYTKLGYNELCPLCIIKATDAQSMSSLSNVLLLCMLLCLMHRHKIKVFTLISQRFYQHSPCVILLLTMSMESLLLFVCILELTKIMYTLMKGHLSVELWATLSYCLSEYVMMMS